MSGAGRPAGPAGPPRHAVPDEPAPPLGGWSRLYALVILALALSIAVCAWLSRIGS